jgi:two-component system phosphate regulon sensor histidine kinase PhoR
VTGAPSNPGSRPSSASATDQISRIADVPGLAVLELDQQMVVRRASAEARSLLGRSRLVGLTAIEALADHRAEALVRAASHDGVTQGEMTLADAPGRRILVRAKRSGDAVLVVLEDLTELRRLQRVRSDFVDNVSHELRTPLTNVRLLVETLDMELEHANVDPGVRERVASIDRETAHLVELVNELLDLSRLEQGAAQLRIENVDLGDVARAAMERVRLFAERNGVTVVSDVPAELPPVKGDAERLGQLLLNVLHNAVKFSPPGSTVSVSGRAAGNEVVMSVRDQGPGISSTDLERVFERFYKVDRARTRSAGGTGLGLAIARHVAESHGGRIWAESEEGRGSTFSFAIPTATG